MLTAGAPNGIYFKHKANKQINKCKSGVFSVRFLSLHENDFFSVLPVKKIIPHYSRMPLEKTTESSCVQNKMYAYAPYSNDLSEISILVILYQTFHGLPKQLSNNVSELRAILS